MSQIQDGTVTVTNGSTLVYASAGVDWTDVQPGDIFGIVGSDVLYQIASAAYNGGATRWEITLTAAYASATGSGKQYSITNSFTPNYGIPYPETGDVMTAAIVKRALVMIDSIFSSGVGLEADTRRSLAVHLDDATGDTYGIEQVSAAQTGDQKALRVFTSSFGSSYLAFGKYTSATAFTEYGRFDASGILDLKANSMKLGLTNKVTLQHAASTDRTVTIPDATGTLLISSVVVTAAQGGTGFTSYAVGDILYAATTSTLAKRAAVATGNALISAGVGVAPVWGQIGLTTHVTGTLGIGNGGTNITTYALGDLLYSSATNVLAKLAGNITTTMSVLTQTGNGSVSAAPVWTSTTGTGNVVRATSPTLVTPTLGVATATSLNGLTVTTSTGTLTVGNAKTLTVNNTVALTGTDGSTITFGAGGTVVYTSNHLGVHAATTSAQLAGVISDETGSGALVFGTAPTITGGAITALTNFAVRNAGTGAFDMTLTHNGTLTAGRVLTLNVNDAARTISLAGNLTLANAFVTAGAFSLTLTATGITNVTLPTAGTLATLAGAESLTNKKLGSLTTNGLVTTSAGDGTLSVTVPGTNVLTFLATPTSANLAAAITGETGSGALVFGTAPTIAGGSITGLTTFAIRNAGTGAFDMTMAHNGTLTAGRALTWNLNDAARTISLAGNVTLASSFTTAGANTLTLTTTGVTSVTLPTAGTLATLAGVESLTNKKLGSLTTNGLVTTSAGDGTLGVTVPGTGVLAALAVNVGSAGAFVTFNGALGTPSSGTVTNLTGTASININGTVGATTPAAGTFTNLIANTTALFGTGTAPGVVYLASSGFSASNYTPTALIASNDASTSPGTIGLALHNTNITAGAWAPLLVFSKRETDNSHNSTMAAIGVRTPTGSGSGGNYIDGEMHFYVAGTATNGLQDCGYFGQDMTLNLNGHLYVAASKFIAWATRGGLDATADGVFRLTDTAGTSFGRLLFGGTTSAYAAIKRVGAGLAIRLADDSGDAALSGNFNGSIGATTPNTGSFTTLAASSGVQFAVTTITGATTLNGTHHNVICNSASNFTVTIPAASSHSGRVYLLKNKNTGIVTVDATSNGQIFVEALYNTITLYKGDSALLQSDGTNWFLVG